MTHVKPSARGLVVVGASAGGIEPLCQLVNGLPADFAACVLVAVHVPASSASTLPVILSRNGVLPARHARDGESLAPGQILVAPPDQHLVVAGDHVTLTRGPRENGHRPAVDVLFRSAARAWGSRLLGVVLSGSLDDGAAGVAEISAHGGRCLAQQDALFSGMPSAASNNDSPTWVAGFAMARHLVDWLSTVPAPQDAPEIEEWPQLRQLSGRTMSDVSTADEMHHTPETFGCPDCGGSLVPVDDDKPYRFRCRVGHAWSAASLLARQDGDLESALWMALRSLEEKAALQEQMTRRATDHGHDRSAALFATGAVEAGRAARLVRHLVSELGRDLSGGPPETSSAPDEA